MLECTMCQTPTKKTCHGCSTTPYCSTTCQKQHWMVHIIEFDRPGREITTADRLAAMVLSGKATSDRSTVSDYGFFNISSLEDCDILCRVYLDVFTILNIKPKTIHRWRLDNTLYANLLRAYDDAGTKPDLPHYQWLLQHPEKFLPEAVDCPAHIFAYQVMGKVWKDIGATPRNPSRTDMEREMKKWPPHQQLCFNFYISIYNGYTHSKRDAEKWIKFGFCVNDEAGCWDGPLQSIYVQLTQRCTFREFCKAFRTSSLAALMDKHGLREQRVSMPGAGDVERFLSQSPNHIPAVWRLKSYADRPDQIPSLDIIPFGIMNCSTEKEILHLLRLYTILFAKLDVSPYRLQYAAEQDCLYRFVMNLPGFTPSNTDKRFLRRVLKTRNKATFGSKLPPCYS
ncbi:hypothetical protein SISSUDRAFT_1126761 [Sistotremastrum suecicum HHB10207 ss-3]|uniref:MYND-type domain-containing protein n=1 Tax=Sistotremastrum suecicum HHB10207 ss-3 TaxID=1314776 RepID=A0A166FUI4_9AGAM|nr:hypothetical protein SISSUDRAFT_1126761 [Sistotremastrum suecicum HHB10207 ss-3]